MKDRTTSSEPENTYILINKNVEKDEIEVLADVRIKIRRIQIDFRVPPAKFCKTEIWKNDKKSTT